MFLKNFHAIKVKICDPLSMIPSRSRALRCHPIRSSALRKLRCLVHVLVLYEVIIRILLSSLLKRVRRIGLNSQEVFVSTICILINQREDFLYLSLPLNSIIITIFSLERILHRYTSRFSTLHLISTTVELSSLIDNRNASLRARPTPSPSWQRISG